MRILFVMDPLQKLLLRWDNSLYLLSEFQRRGHENWIADAPDLKRRKTKVAGACRKVTVLSKRRHRVSSSHLQNLEEFDLILIRKEPPVDAAYVRMLSLLERLPRRVAIANNPRGIRRTNEKLSILHFPAWIPKTLVSASPAAILKFQKKLGKSLVIKPLDQKGGKGVFLLTPKNTWRLKQATTNGRVPVMAQEFIPANKDGEKRIVILNGDLLAVYEKRARGKEFRANLGLGASFHASRLSPREERLLKVMKPFLLKRGLYFVGIDVLEGRLIEINVTSPAGVTEAKFLNPKSRPVEAWADFLEHFARARQGQS